MKDINELHPYSEEWEMFIIFLNKTIIMNDDTIRTLWKEYQNKGKKHRG